MTSRENAILGFGLVVGFFFGVISMLGFVV